MPDNFWHVLMNKYIIINCYRPGYALKQCHMMIMNTIFDWHRYNQFIFAFSVTLRIDYESVLIVLRNSSDQNAVLYTLNIVFKIFLICFICIVQFRY